MRAASVATKTRFTTIDALRGVGAFAVMCHHLAGNLLEYDWAPAIVDTLMAYGNLGVPLFFVVSGFVIAHSTNDAVHSGKFLGIFALKRSIRLDPTYWCAIGITLALLLAKTRFISSEGNEFPEFRVILAHLFYMQTLLQVPAISPVYWTLCMEIQFYLAFVVSRMLFPGSTVTRSAKPRPTKPFFNGKKNWAIEHWLFGMYLVSLLIYVRFIPLWIPGLFIEFWFLFYLGVAVNWYLSGRMHSWRLGAVLLIATAFLLISGQAYLAAGIISTLFILVAGKRKALTRWLVYPPLMYLGKISYSLYLVHPDIGWSTISVGKKFVTARNPSVGLLLFCCGVATSIMSAHLLWYLIELPTHAFAKRLKYPDSISSKRKESGAEQMSRATKRTLA